MELTEKDHRPHKSMLSWSTFAVMVATAAATCVFVASGSGTATVHKLSISSACRKEDIEAKIERQRVTHDLNPSELDVHLGQLVVHNEACLSETLAEHTGEQLEGGAHSNPASFALLASAVASHHHPAFKRVCESGFNGGHSAVAMLTANRHVQVVSIDIMSHKYAHAGAAFVEGSFPGRHTLLRGDVFDVLSKTPPLNCDFVLVDTHPRQNGQAAFGKEMISWIKHLSSPLSLMMWETESIWWADAVAQHFTPLPEVTLVRSVILSPTSAAYAQTTVGFWRRVKQVTSEMEG